MKSKRCLSCNKKYNYYPYQKNTKFCSNKCRLIYGLGQFKNGSIPPNKGIPLKNWMSNQKNTDRKNKISNTMVSLHIKRTNYTKDKIRNAQCGNKSVHWKGGRTKLLYVLRSSYYYRDWRESIFKRDNYTCQKCNKTNCWIEAHHIKLFSIILDNNNITTVEGAKKCGELWDLKNGITLCESCHYKANHKGKVMKR